MLQSSEIPRNQEFFGGWVRDYIAAMAVTNFPVSYQMFVGASILTSVVGRRCELRGVGYTLWPPIWTMLLGTSGVGKSASIALGQRVLNYVEPHMDTDAFMSWTPDTFTRRGIMRRGIRIQKAYMSGHLEGIVLVDEFASVMANRTGTEINAGFFIKAGDMKTVSDETAEHGDQTLLNPAFGCVVASSMGMLRPVVNFDQFIGGGLIFRFFAVHEMDPIRELGGDPDEDTLEELADRAMTTRAAAPARMEVTEGARALLRRYRALGGGRSTNFDLIGFWQRIDGFILKLSMARAISEMRFEINETDIEATYTLLVNHIFPPMVEIAGELRQGHGKADLLRAVDNLYLVGDRGMSTDSFKNLLPTTTLRAQGNAIAWLEDRGLIHSGNKGGEPWVWRHAKDAIDQ